MPAAEPGREIDDWGRSQRVFDLVEPLLDFYYRYWFRVEVEGVENVARRRLSCRTTRRAPPDAPMIMQSTPRAPEPRPIILGWDGQGYRASHARQIRRVVAPIRDAQRLLGD